MLQGKKIIGTLFFIILFLTACQTSNEPTSDKDLHIYTSIYPIQYLVEEIAGNTAVVQSIYPPGVDAHTYEPTTKEITKIAEGDAFIYLGRGMESFAESAAETLQSQGVLFVEIGEDESLFNGDSNERTDHEHTSDLDPHIWLDPLRMINMGERIKDELASLHPENEQQYMDNLNQLKSKLTMLDNEFKEILDKKDNKQIIVTHAAYGYWEERYGIEQIAI